MTCPAVERNIMTPNHNGRQRQYTESTYISDHEITCFGSEIEPHSLSEEFMNAYPLNEFEKERIKFKLSEPQTYEFGFSSLMKNVIDQRSLKFVDSKC
jgi:hypothetical protein